LTHWAEIVGADIARIAEPLKLNYPKDGFGADLVVLCVGANAPLVQMQIPDIIERVNSCYGYRAITRVKVTQTRGKHAGASVAHAAMSQSNLPPPTGLVPSGFAEEATPFQHRTKADILRVSKKQDMHRALSNVQNPALKTALESLGESVFSVSD
ncbi:MAG: DciA family protein, partial [Proteobacteria bacterium]|nr:DciA family protein [Pseudomonadota bacterium]